MVENSMAGAADDAKDDVSKLRADITKLSDTVTSLIAQQAGSARATMSNAASKVREQGEYAYREAEAMARQKAKDLEQTIVANPFASVGAALGIGLVLGLLSRRR
jgi:ElaB/YqjD/DUF883 family membrane-anchored ribosome-binding protein